MSYRGGYYTFHTQLLKAGLHQHTAALRNPVSSHLLGALNQLQKTAWTVNPFILDVMSQAWERGDLVGGLPSPDSKPMPPEVPAQVWEGMTKEQRAELKFTRSEIHAENNRAEGKRAEFMRKLNLAKELVGAPFWYPHALDFRGRCYPLPQDLHPQGDDVSRGLLMFDRAAPEPDETALRWMIIAIANAAGQDKLAFEDRIKWFKSHYELLADSVRDPLDGERFWCGPDVDAPWQLLSLMKDYQRNVSQVPVALDATCSGIQHLSAMGLDPVGGRAVNLMNTGRRADLYSDVARKVAERISAEALAGNAMAQAWAGKASRSVVKRAVMTTPYGVTDRGITTQLMQDGHLDWMPKSLAQQEHAVYMTKHITAALEDTATSAREIMKYFQDCARALADADRPLEWMTPSGLHVRQQYMGQRSGRVQTLMGEFRATSVGVDLDGRKQTQSAAPNVVHSFDGAHLAATVLRCYTYGVYDLALIHDSYGTHACNVDTLGRALRETFVEMYQENQLEKFEIGLRMRNPGVDLPECPKRGDLDITSVLDSPYFFS